MAVIAFDLGGTHLRCGVVDGEGVVRFARTFHSRRSWDAILAIMTAFSKKYEAAADPGSPIVVAFPGPIGPGGEPVTAPTVAGDRPVPKIRDYLNAATGRDVVLINDVSSAALHIARYITASRFIVVTVSSGIGSKIFDRRCGVLDRPSHAGEIGHVVVDRASDAPLCDCGGRGHLGAIASGRGTLALARRNAIGDPEGFARSRCASALGATPETLSNERHLVPAALAGDPWVLDVIARSVDPLASTLATVTQAAGLERIVVMGGFALALRSLYRDALTRALATYLDGRACCVRADDLVMSWSIDDEPGLRGASAFVEQRDVAIR